MFPNTEVGAVEVKTSDSEIAGRKYYKVEGIGRTLPTYRWFFNLEDIYTVWIDPETKRPVRFESDLHEGDYTFQSYYNYDWENNQVFTRWRRRQKPYQEKTMPLTPEIMDASRSSSPCADPTPTASSPASRRRSRWCFRTRSGT